MLWSSPKLSVHGLHTCHNRMNSSGGTHTPAIPHRRKLRNSTIPAVLRSRYAAPGTPLFQWKFHKKHSAVAGIGTPVNFRQGFLKSELSARKLAARLWQLRFMEVSGDGGAAFGDGSFQYSSKAEEEATKWDSEASKESTQIHSRKPSKDSKLIGDSVASSMLKELLQAQIHSRKPSKDSKLFGDSVVSSMLKELLHAQRCISKLKAAQKSSKKKVKLLVSKLEEEKVIWKRREHQKTQAMFDDFKVKLGRERGSRERIELLNTKIMRELAEANQSAKQFMKNYEEEKRGREIMEDVCSELAKQIGEDRAMLQKLQRESMKIREEVEEEKKMLQLAELLREDLVQMKLVDAKLAFEDQYNQTVQLIAYLQTFLRSRGLELNIMDLGEAELIKQAAKSIDIEHIVKIPYDFSKSDDIWSIYEELRKANANERVITPYFHPSPTGLSSTIHIVSSPDENGLNNNSVLHHTSSSSDYNTSSELSNPWEIVSHGEDKRSSSPPQRRNASVDNTNQDKNILGREEEYSENTGLELSKTGVTGVCSVTEGQLKQKASSASKLRSRPSNGTTRTVATSSHSKRTGDSVTRQNSEDFMFDDCNRGLSTGSLQRVWITSPCKGSGGGGLTHSESVGQRNSTNAMNPHITRGMKGSIEWPRGIPKSNLKAVSLEARVRSQKSQLQHILKPKAKG